MNQYLTICWKKVRVTAILKIRAFDDLLILCIQHEKTI